MFVQIKRAVCLDGKDYSKGVHEIPDEVMEKLSSDSFFMGLIKEGSICEAEHKVQASEHDLVLRQKAAQQKLVKALEDKKAKIQAEAEEKEEAEFLAQMEADEKAKAEEEARAKADAEVESEDEDSKEGDEPSQKKAKKQKR